MVLDAGRPVAQMEAWVSAKVDGDDGTSQVVGVDS